MNFSNSTHSHVVYKTFCVQLLGELRKNLSEPIGYTPNNPGVTLNAIKRVEITFHWILLEQRPPSKPRENLFEFFACVDISWNIVDLPRSEMEKGPKGPVAISSSREFGFSSFWWLVKLLETTISRYIYCWDTSKTRLSPHLLCR